jgi:hypothetical protein
LIIPGILAPLPLYGRYLLQECLSLSMNFRDGEKTKAQNTRGFVTSTQFQLFSAKDGCPAIHSTVF